jgi:methylglutaconyl-CoA hydratase
MSEASLLFDMDPRGTVTLTLNRPSVHNAFDVELIDALTMQLERLQHDDSVRALVLRGAGASFSAGADLNWMKSMAGYSQAESFADAMRLANLMRLLDRFPKPTLAAVHGAAFGGGIGLVACCDIAVATDDASFCLSEVLLGLIPAVISPYVVAAMGGRATRRYFLTAERFDAQEAVRLGLVHKVVANDELEACLEHLLDALHLGGPQAQLAAKRLIETVQGAEIHDSLIEETAHRIARIRSSAEGQEGIQAFLEKREPSWWSP